MFKRTLIGLILATVAITGFAMTFITGSALTKECGVSPVVLVVLRFAFAGGVMLCAGCATAKGRAALFAPRPRDWASLAWLGVVGTAFMAWCVFMGCARVCTANASMADALTPLLIFILSVCKARRIEPRGLVGLLCGFVGALLVIQVLNRDGLALEAYSIGDFYIFLSAAAWGIYTVYGRTLVRHFGAAVFSTWTMLFGAVSFGLFLPFGDFAWPATPKAWALVGMLGTISTLLPFWAWNAAQKYLPTSVLAVTAYCTPVVTVVLAFVLLGETATFLQCVGTAFVIASAAVETGRRHTADDEPSR